MSSPEFQEQLEKAREFRRQETHALRTARASGLSSDARNYRQVLREDPRYQEARNIVLLDRWDTLGRKIPEFSQREWEEVGEVLSGVNNGVKAGLFLEIAQNTSPGTYMPVDAVVERFKELFYGTELLEAMSKHHIKNYVIKYCRESLCDVGLLAEEWEIDEQGIQSLVGFGVTQRGRKIGIPVSLSVLWYENKTQESLYPVLGPTNSSGQNRAPLNRARVLDYMVRHPYEVREADLVTALGIEDSVIAVTLNSLSAHKLIDYKAVANHTDKTQIRYGEAEGKDLADAYSYPSYPLLFNQMVEILKETGEPISTADVLARFPDEIKQNWKEKSLKAVIARILSHLAREGYLTRVNRFEGRKKQSDASLTLKGRDLYFQLVYPSLLLSSRKTLSEDCLSRIRQVANNLAFYTRNSAELYYPYSMSYKRRESGENKSRALKILQDNPDSSFTFSDLSEKMGLDIETIRSYLKPQTPGSLEITFSLDGKLLVIEREKIKGVWYFRVKEPEGK